MRLRDNSTCRVQAFLLSLPARDGSEVLAFQHCLLFMVLATSANLADTARCLLGISAGEMKTPPASVPQPLASWSQLALAEVLVVTAFRLQMCLGSSPVP